MARTLRRHLVSGQSPRTYFRNVFLLVSLIPLVDAVPWIRGQRGRPRRRPRKPFTDRGYD
jgi:hypothetical protein